MVHDQLVDDRAEPLLPAEEAGKLRSALRIDLSVGCSRGGVLQPCRRKHEPPSREARAQLPLGPNEHATEGDICDMYARLGWDERDQLGAVLVLKLALSLTASGMPTYTAEPLLRTVAAAANLPHCHLLLGMRSLQISFGGGPVHVLSSRQGKVLHRLSDLHCLTLAVAVAVEPATLMALQAVDAINRRRSPFGWAIEALAYHGFACAAAPAIFGGGLGDFAVVALASVPVRLTLAACGALPQLSALSDLLLPIVAGVAAPSLCALFELDACHAATATLSLLLFELPGSELLFGATELKRGNLVGATRLVHAVVLTMFMAVAGFDNLAGCECGCGVSCKKQVGYDARWVCPGSIGYACDGSVGATLFYQPEPEIAPCAVQNNGVKCAAKPPHRHSLRYMRGLRYHVYLLEYGTHAVPTRPGGSPRSSCSACLALRVSSQSSRSVPPSSARSSMPPSPRHAPPVQTRGTRLERRHPSPRS